MSSLHDPAFRRRLALLLGLYALVFVAVAVLDLGTTSLALTRPDVTEGNVYAKHGDGYVAAQAWLLTLGGGLVIEGFLLFAGLFAHRVSATVLARPMASFGAFYVNPFASRVLDRSPLHTLSYVLAFAPLRVLAAANNTIGWLDGDPPLGRLIGMVARRTSPAFGFWAVMGPLFIMMTVALSPLAARVLTWLRGEGARGGKNQAPTGSAPPLVPQGG